ncbi:MAG: hypothetical protein MK171_11105 [Pirellulales bacterium]|nr:hypothetical protein [Pirellulales bacterium]
MKDAKQVLVVLLLLFSVISLGCRNNPAGRQPVEGRVTLDGTPLQDGDLALRPVGKGPSVGGRIANGRFRIARKYGPLPGSYHVLITSHQETGREMDLSDYSNEKVKVAETRQIVPAQYNELTELKMEVTSGGENKFDYSLDSK